MIHCARSKWMVSAIALTVSLGTSNTANAADAVVSPLVSRGVDPLIVLNMTSLIASELDFMGLYENVDQLEAMPSGMNGGCLSSTSCLSKVGAANGAGAVVAGALSSVGSGFDMHLVLFDNGRIVRKKDFNLPSEPSAIADSMGAMVKELATGQSAQQVAQSESLGDFDGASEADMFEEEDDFEVEVGGGEYRTIPLPQGGDNDELDDFDLFEDDGADAQREAEAAAAAAREEETQRMRRQEAEAQRRAEKERERKQEIQARRQAEERERREEEAEAKRQAEAARAATATASSDDLDDFSFGKTDLDDIGVEDVQFGSAASAMIVEDDEESYDRGYSDDNDYDFDEPETASRYKSYDDDFDEVSDLDSSSRRETSSRKSTSSYSRDESSRSAPRFDESTTRRTSEPAGSATLTGRVGYSKFQDLAFVTYGAEAVFLVSPSVGVVGGIEAYSTKRTISKDLLEKLEEELAEELDNYENLEDWQTILPFNVGMQYRMGSGAVQPYLGGDLLFIPGYVKDSGGMATGLRARSGLNYMMVDTVGLNLNVSAGILAGKHFENVQHDMSNSGLVPQISGGTTFVF